LYRNLTVLRGSLADGTVLTVAGTLAGTRMVPKVVEVNGYEIEVPFERYHLAIRYADRPGLVAIYARLLGDAGINIVGLQVAHPDAGGYALSVLTVDSPVSDEIVEEMRAAVGAEFLRQIEIVEV
jgi:D-3-phosphoglycerate dehydrogenase